MPLGREADSMRLESELKGKTLLVYWYILGAAKSVVGVREVQRSLGFSSPSVASYHLDKLRELGLVKKKRGDYVLVETVRVGLLRHFVSLGRLLLPRYLFYAVFFTTMLAGYLILYSHPLSVYDATAIMFGAFASAVLWYETVRVWRQKPF